VPRDWHFMSSEQKASNRLLTVAEFVQTSPKAVDSEGAWRCSSSVPASAPEKWHWVMRYH